MKSSSEFGFLLLPAAPRRADIVRRTRELERGCINACKRARDVAVVNEKVFFDVECCVAAFEISGAIVFDTMPQDQILCACRRTNRIGLHETQLLQGAIECGGFGKVSRDSKASQVIESDRIGLPKVECTKCHRQQKICDSLATLNNLCIRYFQGRRIMALWRWRPRLKDYPQHLTKTQRLL